MSHQAHVEFQFLQFSSGSGLGFSITLFYLLYIGKKKVWKKNTQDTPNVELNLNTTRTTKLSKRH